MCGTEGILLHHPLQHHVSQHAKQVVRRCITRVGLVLFGLAGCFDKLIVRLDQFELIELHHDPMGLRLEMRRSQGFQGCATIGIAEYHEILWERHGHIGVLDVIGLRTILDFLGGVGSLCKVEIGGDNRPTLARGVDKGTRRRSFHHIDGLVAEMDDAGAAPVTNQGRIDLVGLGNMIPEVVAHTLEVPDVVANQEALVSLGLQPTIKLEFHGAVVGVNVHENHGRCKNPLAPLGPRRGIPEILSVKLDVAVRPLGQFGIQTIVNVKGVDRIGHVVGQSECAGPLVGTNVEDLLAVAGHAQVGEKAVMLITDAPEKLLVIIVMKESVIGKLIQVHDFFNVGM